MSMKQLLVGVVAVATVFSFGACSNDETVKNEFGNEIILSSNLAVHTRTIGQDLQGGQLVDGRQAGVFVTDGATGAEMLYDNNALTVSGNGFTYAEPMYYPVSGKANIYAYTPYEENAHLSTSNYFKVAADQTTDEGYLASDLLYGVPDRNPVTSTGNSVVLKFVHKLAKININLLPGNGITSLAGTSVRILNTYPGVMFTPETGESVLVTDDVAAITVASFGEAEEKFECSAIVVPQTVEAGTQFIEVKLADGTMLYYTLKEAKELVNAHQYTYDVTVNRASMDVSSSLDDWFVNDKEEVSAEVGEEIKPVRAPQIGDYYLADGTYISGTSETPDNCIGFVFSTRVSAEDAIDGYKAYVMGLVDQSNNAWYNADAEVVNSPLADVLTTEDAYADLTGYASTRTMWEDSEFVNYTAVTKFASNGNYSADKKFAAPAGTSGWFVPSVGQWLDILKNLGGATTLTESTSTVNEASVPMLKTEVDAKTNLYSYLQKFSVDSELGTFLANISGSEAFLREGGPTYGTVSEYSADLIWVIKFDSNTGTCTVRPDNKKGLKRIHPILAIK